MDVRIALALFLTACAPLTLSEPAPAWLPFQQGLPTQTTVLTLASDPRAPMTVFAGAYDTTGVYRSNDGARTWRAANEGLGPVFALRFIGDTLYAGTRAGLYRWQGAHWERVRGVPPVAIYAIARGADGATLVATDRHGIFISADVHTWTRLPGLANEILLSVAALDAQTFIVGTSGNGAFI